MGEQIGCDYREFCDLYKGKYKQSPVVSPDFRQTCDTTSTDSFPEGLCPCHDIYSGLFAIISDSLTKTNKSLDATLQRLRKSKSE